MKRLALPPLAFGSALMCAGAAVAQFGGPFDAPRPPGSVPVRPQPQQAPPPQYQPPQYAPQQAPAQQAAAPAGRGGIQSEDLPAPGSTQGAVQPSALPPGPGPNRQQPAGQPPPPGSAAVPAAPPPATATPAPAPPPAEVVTAPPARRIANPTAVFNGLDKITGRITAFDAAIGETVQFGALQVTTRGCYSRPPNETPLTDGFVEVDEVTLQGDVRRIFTGWMFAASPGLHGVEHAVYDVWLVDCKGGAQVTAETQPATSASAPARQPRQQGQGTTQQRQPRQPAPALAPGPGVR
jgi:hypothetical protein